MALQPNSTVRLNTPDNPRLHGSLATVESVMDWGAHVLTEAAATGRYRASWWEMELLEETNGRSIQMVSQERPHSFIKQEQARDQGYTGSLCPTCGGCRMRQNGTCEVCEECGGTSGCS